MTQRTDLRTMPAQHAAIFLGVSIGDLPAFERTGPMLGRDRSVYSADVEQAHAARFYPSGLPPHRVMRPIVTLQGPTML